MGRSEGRRVCDDTEHQMYPLLLEGRSRSPLLREWPTGLLDERPPLHVSTTASASKSCSKDPTAEIASYPYNSVVARAQLVPDCPWPFGTQVHQTSRRTRPNLLAIRESSPPQYTQPIADCIVHRSSLFSLRVQNIITESRKPSTRKSYKLKWARFCHWLGETHTSPTSVGLPVVFDFLLYLKDSGLSISSLRVYLAALSAYHIKVFIICASDCQAFPQGNMQCVPPYTQTCASLGFTLSA